MFEIEFIVEAEADLAWFKKSERNIILDGIEASLRYEPRVITRNRKQLRPNATAEWELRIDNSPYADALTQIIPYCLSPAAARNELSFSFVLRAPARKTKDIPMKFRSAEGFCSTQSGDA